MALAWLAKIIIIIIIIIIITIIIIGNFYCNMFRPFLGHLQANVFK